MKTRALLTGLLAATFMATPALAAQNPAAADDTEIEALKAQLASLQARLDALEDKTTAPPTPAQVETKSPAEGPESWIANTKIGGKAYFNVSAIDQHSDGARSAQSGVQVDVKRFYLTVDHRFSDIFSANLTTDFRYNSNGTSDDTVVYVKKAYLQAKLAPELTIRIGSADLPWVSFVENIYGYRFVENTLIDRTKYGTSADWGVHVSGALAKGLVSYAVSAVNGSGYKTLARKSDTIDLEGRLSVEPISHVIFAVGGYTGKLGKSNAASTIPEHRATRINALAAYSSPRFHAGVEYFHARNWNNITSLTTDTSSGWSLFGSFSVSDKISIFGRHDWVSPNRETNSQLHERYFNVGINYQPVKDIDLALVLKRDRAENGLIATSNGTIGGDRRGTYNEIGIWSQVKF